MAGHSTPVTQGSSSYKKAPISKYSLKVNDIHEEHDDLDDREDDHGQRRRANGHLLLVGPVGLIALQRLRGRHHVAAVAGQHVASHPLVAQRHAIELLKVQVAIVVLVAALQDLGGNVGGYVPAVAVRDQILQLMRVDQAISVGVVLE